MAAGFVLGQERGLRQEGYLSVQFKLYLTRKSEQDGRTGVTL